MPRLRKFLDGYEGSPAIVTNKKRGQPQRLHFDFPGMANMTVEPNKPAAAAPPLPNFQLPTEEEEVAAGGKPSKGRKAEKRAAKEQEEQANLEQDGGGQKPKKSRASGGPRRIDPNEPIALQGGRPQREGSIGKARQQDGVGAAGNYQQPAASSSGKGKKQGRNQNQDQQGANNQVRPVPLKLGSGRAGYGAVVGALFPIIIAVGAMYIDINSTYTWAINNVRLLKIFAEPGWNFLAWALLLLQTYYITRFFPTRAELRNAKGVVSFWLIVALVSMLTNFFFIALPTLADAGLTGISLIGWSVLLSFMLSLLPEALLRYFGPVVLYIL